MDDDAGSDDCCCCCCPEMDPLRDFFPLEGVPLLESRFTLSFGLAVDF